MASVQCHKPCEQSYNEGQHKSSLSRSTMGQPQTECYVKSQTDYTNQGMFHGHAPTYTPSMEQNKDHGHGQTQTTHASNDNTCASQGKTKKRGERKKRGLFQRIKDAITSDSSSDSESDDDKCGKTKK